MCKEELRTKRALSLYAVHEAGVLVDRLTKEAKWLGMEFQSFGTQLMRNPMATLESNQERFGHVTVTAAYDIVRQLEEATSQLAEATRKDELLQGLEPR
jgi:hypothetical protein